MDKVPEMRKWRPFTVVLFVAAWACLASCAATVARTKADMKPAWDIKIPEEQKPVAHLSPPLLKTPDFSPAIEDATPLRSRVVNIAARNTPLSDVLHVIAEAASLNLIMERGVDPTTPMNFTLKNVTAAQALDMIFSSVDYFYTFRDNALTVKAIDTRLFELGHPALEQRYTIDVGGDMLAGATSATSSTSGGAGGGTAAGSTGVKGAVNQITKSDETAYRFWEAVEKTIAGILRVPVPSAAGAPSLTGAPSVTGAPFVRPQTFTVNRLAGSVLVTGSKRELEQVGKYIENLKRAIGRQVLVEAKVIEVQLNNNLQFGIDWNYVVGSVTMGTQNFASVLPSGGPLTKIAVTSSKFSPVLQALQTQGDVRILSDPRVSIMNGQTALLSVGRSTSFIARVDTTITQGLTPITTYTVQTSSILSGMLIGIVPYIDEKGEISMTVTPIVSNLVALNTANVGGLVSVSLPVVDLREVSTTVKVQNGQTIILGGLISAQESVQDNQVPILGNIPFLGYLFKSRNKQQIKNELVVLLQPILAD